MTRLMFAFLIIGLITSRGVDLLRKFDKADRVPKGWWLIASWGLGVALAFVGCHSDAAVQFFGLPADAGCTDVLLIGAGFGSVAGFWHEVLSAFSARSGPAPTPNGFIP